MKLTENIKEINELEQDLGIDLVTLFKALKNGIWYRRFGHIEFINDKLFFDFNNKLIFKRIVEYSSSGKSMSYAYQTVCYLREYKSLGNNSWALTKEELI